ncbi:MAG: autotransporter domain-containing protein, partial [Gallionellaceae bacterium]|nr:autotransporter domain-containing protein [Gallionellaceae bacterium]
DNTGTYTNNGANFDRVNTNTGTINNNAGFNWTGDVGSNAGTINNVTGATWQGNFTTAGTVNNGGTITGTFTQTGGTTTNTGSISGATAVTNGLFTGAGSTGSLTLNNGATLAPGNGGIGAMTVNGNIVFNAGSVYQVETTPTPDQSDKINASGTATLTGGAVSVLAGAGDYALQTTYTILTANGGLGGTTFTGVTTDLAFLTPTLTYDATHAMLTLDRNNIDFSSVGSTRNQRATGEDVETLGSGNAVWDAVVQLTDDTARGAFDQMSGEIHASAKGAMLEDTRFVREMALDRSQQTAGSGPWASAFGSWATDDSDGNAAKLKRDVTGVFIGADTQAGDWHLGGLLGYSQSDLTVDARNSSGDTHDFHLGAYGGTHIGAINLRLGAAHTSHSISTKRAVAFTGITDRLTASYNARTTQVFGEAGYGVALSAQTSVEPFVNLAYVNHATDAFHERGGVAALASEKSDSHHTAFSTAGIRAETKLDLGGVTAKARGSAGWHHAFGDTDMASTHAFSSGDVFTVYGVPVTRDALSLEAGLDFELSPNATAGISYNGLHGSDYSDNGVRAEIKVKF